MTTTPWVLPPSGGGGRPSAPPRRAGRRRAVKVNHHRGSWAARRLRYAPGMRHLLEGVAEFLADRRPEYAAILHRLAQG